MSKIEPAPSSSTPNGACLNKTHRPLDPARPNRTHQHATTWAPVVCTGTRTFMTYPASVGSLTAPGKNRKGPQAGSRGFDAGLASSAPSLHPLCGMPFSLLRFSGYPQLRKLKNEPPQQPGGEPAYCSGAPRNFVGLLYSESVIVIQVLGVFSGAPSP